MPGQLLKYIPQGIVQAAAREHGVDAQARSYPVWSHLAAMVFVQLAHAFSLNDVCDWLRLKRGAIAGFGVTPPARNTLSHANKGRSADFVQAVFWRTLAHLHHCEPAFGGKRKGRRLLHRFKVEVHAGGLHRDGTGGQLHGLGAAPPAQPKPPGAAEADGEERAARRAKEPWGGD